jgi:small subunit ribosomal protein S7
MALPLAAAAAQRAAASVTGWLLTPTAWHPAHLVTKHVSSSASDGGERVAGAEGERSPASDTEQPAPKQPATEDVSAKSEAIARSLLASFHAPAMDDKAAGPAQPVQRRQGAARRLQQQAPDAASAVSAVELPLDASDVVQVVMQAVENCKPSLKVKQVKEGNRVRSIPFMVHPREQRSLAVRWILEAAHKRREGGAPGVRKPTMAACLASELLLAANKQGSARQKRDEMHRLAVENRANMLRRL